MYKLVVGVCHVAIRIRDARSLKDKRAVTRSVIDRLKNRGFSVVECGQSDAPDIAHLGFSFSGTHTEGVTKSLDEAKRQLMGDYEVLKCDREIFRYEPEESDDLGWMIDPQNE